MARRKKFVSRTPKAARRAARKRRSGVAERRKKEFTYRGLSVAELKELPLWPPEDDPDALSVVTILPARARRSLLRGLTEEEEHFLARLRDNPGKTVRTHSRSLYILPEMVGRTVGIHDGREFRNIEILPEMIGHALGEYAPTRRSVTHTGPGVGATRSSKHVALK